MALLVGLLVAFTVVVLVVRAAAAPGGARHPGRPRAPRPPRAQRPRPLAPDDDPEFLAELHRRTRRDGGPTA